MTLCVVACWLLLNAQLALAAHLCDISVIEQPLQTSTPAHHGSASNASSVTMTHATHITAMAKTPLCDKHCIPDNVQKSASPLHLDAIAHDSSTLLALPEATTTPNENAWLTPPRTGPPAEIVYCRFRE